MELEMVSVDSSSEEFWHKEEQIGRYVAGEVGQEEVCVVLFCKLGEIIAHLYPDENDPIHGENLM